MVHSDWIIARKKYLNGCQLINLNFQIFHDGGLNY